MKLLLSANKKFLFPFVCLLLITAGAGSYDLLLLSQFIDSITNQGIGSAYPYLIAWVLISVLLIPLDNLLDWCRWNILFELRAHVLINKLQARKSFGVAFSETKALVEDRIGSLIFVVQTALSITAALIAISVSQWQVGLIALAGLVISCAVSWYQTKKANKANQTRTEAEGELRNKASNFEKNYMTAALDGADMKALAEDASWRLAIQTVKVEKINTFRNFATSFTSGAIYVALLVAASILVFNGSPSIGTIVLSATIAGTITGQVGSLTGEFAEFLNNKWATTLKDKGPALKDADFPGGAVTGLVGHKLEKKGGGKKFLNPIDIDFQKPSNVLLKGPNGAGKTTLVRILSGLQNDYEGTLAYKGSNERDYQSLPVIYQSSDTRLLPGTAKDNIAYFQANPDQSRIDQIVSDLQIERLLGRDVAGLSEGETSLVKIAIMLNNDASIRVFDEVFANIDSHIRDGVVAKALKGDCINIVIAHHNLQFDFDQVIKLAK